MNIGIIGKLGSGKTTAANYLVSQYGYIKHSLADPMREIVSNIFGIQDKTDPRYREIMQLLGTDWFRSYDRDVWVNYLKHQIDQRKQPVVCDDVRFLNEAEAMLEWGWKLIYIMCPSDIRIARSLARDGTFDPKCLEHESEMQIDLIYDLLHHDLVIIDGSRSIKYLTRKLDGFIQLLQVLEEANCGE